MRWLRGYWDEEDVTYFFEVDDEGWVQRQVEHRGERPTVAAALAEIPTELAAVQAYEGKYGTLAEQPIGAWDAQYRHVALAASEFEAIWQHARASLEQR